MLFTILTLFLCKTFVVKVLMYSQSHPHKHRREVSSALDTEDCAKMHFDYFEKYSNI